MRNVILSLLVGAVPLIAVNTVRAEELSIRDKVRATYNTDPSKRPTITEDDLKQTAEATKRYSACLRRKYLDLKEEPKGTEYDTFRTECEKCIHDPEQPGCNPKFTDAEEVKGTATRDNNLGSNSPVGDVQVIPRH